MTDPVDELLESWDAPEPPVGFADRVLAADGIVGSTRARRWPWIALVVAASVVLFVSVPRTDGGALDAVSQTELSLGASGKAVATAGARIEWESRTALLGGHDLVAHHTEGAAFYSLAPKTTFTIHTPNGVLTGRGGSFEIGVEPMSLKTGLTGAIVGAGLTAAVFLTVYDGEVHLKTAQGKTTVGAGQRADVSQGEPVRVQSRHAAERPKALRVALAAVEQERDALREQIADLSAAPGDMRVKLAAEKRALKAEIAELKAALEEERAARKQVEGEAVPFPDDLPELFTEKGQAAAFQEIIDTVGYPDGRVDAVDCSEFPCIVYGYVGQKEPGMEGSRALFNDFERAWKGHFKGKSNSFHWSTNGQVKDDEGNEGMLFGAMVLPSAVELSGAQRGQIQQRMMLRQQQYREAQRGE